ncbi:MAG: glycosyltransferase [Lachnospiraceae bacterium]|nr:glycosyltransferase [Lachnospiraceae bacterium]
MKKIVLIGPVYPYKGGISHYTGLMYKSLSKEYDTEMVSYAMQYPKILFKKEQKDYGNATFKIEDTKYWINTANPFSCISSALKIRKLCPDLVIFQWWHPYFAPCYWLMERILGRKIRKLFLCHNVFPHERFPADRFLSRLVLKKGDCFITHSGLDTRDLLSIKPKAIYRQTVIPTYNAFKMQDLSKVAARQILKAKDTEKILLFFGLVREYKGLKHIIKALPDIIKELPEIKLYIVGDFGENEDEYLKVINECGVMPYVQIYGGYIPDKEVEKFFMASDLVVLPYESATQSAVVQTAFGFEKPVIVTDVGGLPEVVDDGKTGYVVPVNNEQELAAATIRFFKEDKATEFKEHIREKAYKFSWERMNKMIQELMGDE